MISNLQYTIASHAGNDRLMRPSRSKLLGGLMVAMGVVATMGMVGLSHASQDAQFPMPEGKTYIEECGGCHTAYAPGLLPARSWIKLMSGLSRHFGDDASLEDKTRDKLTADLVALAADSRAANALMQRINAAIPASVTPERISKTGFFNFMHDEVSSSIWRRPRIGTPSNCMACHTKTEAGRYHEREVHIPK